MNQRFLGALEKLSCLGSISCVLLSQKHKIPFPYILTLVYFLMNATGKSKPTINTKIKHQRTLIFCLNVITR